MGLFKKRKPDPYNTQEERIHAWIATLDPGTDEFEKAQAELEKVCITRDKSRESRRRFDKAGRASFWTKIVGGVGTLLGIGALGYYEMRGNTFSGEKRKLADGLSNIVVNLFRNK